MNSKRLVLGLALLALAVGVAAVGLRSARSACCVVPKICEEYEKLPVCSAFWVKDMNDLCPAAPTGYKFCRTGTNPKVEWTYSAGDRVRDAGDKDCDGSSDDWICYGGKFESMRVLPGQTVTWYGPSGATCP